MSEIILCCLGLTGVVLFMLWGLSMLAAASRADDEMAERLRKGERYGGGE